MNYQAKKTDQYSVYHNTDTNLMRKDSIVQRALNLVNDLKKKERRLVNLCIICYYHDGKLAGQAITTQPCGICNKDQTYSSTATDDLCLDCAKKYHLCKECGADLDLKTRRKLVIP